MPPAIKFFTEHQNDSTYILWFVEKLERLASFLLATAQDVNHRMDRYKWILVEMDSRPDHSLSAPLKNIELTEWEKQQFIMALDGEIYTMPSLRRNYIIQRIDSFVSDGGATYNTKLFTIEHVLPQNPKEDSEWLRIWPDIQQRKFWLNRIANLVPLTRQKNSAAQNYDFQIKKEKYFQTKAGVASYALTTQVINYDQWTPEIVSRRQEELIRILKKEWTLDACPEDLCHQDFLLAGRGGNAKGFPGDDDSFVVRKGSIISSDTTDGFPPNYADLRKRLIQEGSIADGVFTIDYAFTSVSAATAVVLGRSANGRKEWTKLDGQSFAQAGH